MLTIKKLSNSILCLSLLCLIFTSCVKKDEVRPTTEQSNNNQISQEISRNDLNSKTTILQTAKRIISDEESAFSSCNCYDDFIALDIALENGEITEEEYSMAIQALVESLSEEEIAYLFFPACADDGTIFNSSCLAECIGVTDFHICSDDELEDWDGEDDIQYEIDQLSSCFSFIYPVTLVQIDGTQIVVTNEVELWTTIIELEDEMDDVLYPVQIQIVADDSLVTITNEDGFDEIMESCYGDFDGNDSNVLAHLLVSDQ